MKIDSFPLAPLPTLCYTKTDYEQKYIFIYKGDITWKHTSRNLLNSW